MKGILFVVGGGLIGYWLALQRKCSNGNGNGVAGAGSVDVITTATAPPLMPSTMIQQFDATDHATVSPASVTIQNVGAGSLDTVESSNAYLMSR